MPTRKRGRAEMEAVEPPEPPSLLTQIRNKWEFANLAQYINLFGDAVKIDKEVDVEELENEFLRTEPSQRLVQIGLCLLKFVSSYRGLTPELFDEYTRRQYEAKAPHRNPFGKEEEPEKFLDFDVFTKIEVLYQLSQWTFCNPNRIRELMPADEDETYWRTEEIGTDRNGRLYFVLDDNRLYRRTDPPIVEPSRKPKAKSKAGRALARANKKRKVNAEEAAADEENEDTKEAQGTSEDLFGGRKWECLAVSLSDYEEFLAGLRKSKDSEEKSLYRCIEKDVLPEILRAEEERQRKIRQKEKELLTQEKMAHAKRSSRIATKQEKDREAAETEAEERRKREELAEARKIMDRQHKAEQDRQSRMLTREQRIKEREAKRILAEEQLKELSEAQEKAEVRLSERHAKDKIGKKRKALEELEEEEDWFFDCSGCGVHGENLDDGSHSVSCEKCSVWQHSKCLGISEAAAEKDNFHFVCADCHRMEEDAKKPKIPPLKLKASSSVSPPSNKHKKVRLSSDSIEVQVPKKFIAPTTGIPNAYFTNGFSATTSANQAPTGSPMRTLAPSTQQSTGSAQTPKIPSPSSSHQPAITKSIPAISFGFPQGSGAKSTAPPLPPIGNFTTLARTSGTPMVQVPITKQGPPKPQPAPPAYNSPWSQVNGTYASHGTVSAGNNQTSIPPPGNSAQQKPYFSPPQPYPASNTTDGSLRSGMSRSNQNTKHVYQIPAANSQPSQPTLNGSNATTSTSLAPSSEAIMANKQSFSQNAAASTPEGHRFAPTSAGTLELSSPQLTSSGNLAQPKSKSSEHAEPNGTTVSNPALPPTTNDEHLKTNGIAGPAVSTSNPTVNGQRAPEAVPVPGQIS